MTYIVNVNYDEESSHWHAIGENIRGLVMGAGSLDVLIERTNLALSDLLETNDFEVEYKMDHKMKVMYG
jgi:enterochelin esterase-like enzyme